MRSLLLLAACVASDAFFSMGGFSLRGSDAEGQPVEEQKKIVEDEPGVLDSLGFVHLGFLEHRLLSGLTKPQTHNQMLAAGHGHVARAAHGGGGGGDSYKLARGADCKPGGSNLYTTDPGWTDGQNGACCFTDGKKTLIIINY